MPGKKFSRSQFMILAGVALAAIGGIVYAIMSLILNTERDVELKPSPPADYADWVE
jgi:hypothetical protein